MTEQTVYRFYADGFTETFESLDTGREWVLNLVKYGRLDKGSELVIHQGQRFGDCDRYDANCPTKVLTI